MKGMGATSATGATRQTGRSEGVVGISGGGIELGLKVGGIGQLGISTDYGGGIVIGIFGQKIVWGREGGKIYYNIGGLEVIVEARDCVVVETRKIFGQVTGRHVYPDPGCKLPPEPAQPLIPPPIDRNPNNFPLGWRCPDGRSYYLELQPVDEGVTLFLSFNEGIEILAKNYELYSKQGGEGANQPYDPFDDDRADSWFGKGRWVKTTHQYVNWTRYNKYSTWRDRAGGSFGGWVAELQFEYSYEIYSLNYPFYIDNQIGKGGQMYGYKVFLRNLSPYPSCPDGFADNTIPPPIFILPSVPPSAGNQPPMPESCCEALAADIEDIKEVLACKEILAGKMTFPWSWRMPGGQGEEIIMDYPNLLRAIAQMIDHLGIHPPKLTIKDINNAIAGDQSINNQFPSATQAFEATMAQIWDANADVDTLTNFLYRLSWLCVQQSMNLARLSGDVQALKDMLGGATEPVESSITTPFNIGAGVTEAPTKPGKGFGGQQKGKNIDRRIEANTEVSTESLLPDFLRIRENPIIVEKFSGDKDVMDMLSIIILKLESLQNR